MALVWIRMRPEAKELTVQLTPEVRHRNVDGDTIRLTPGLSQEVTEDEWAFIQREHKDVLHSIDRLDNGTKSGSSANPGEAPHQPR